MATFQSTKGIDSMWIRRSTDRKTLAHPEGWRVQSDDWAEWLEAHPDHVIVTWFGINDQYYLVRRAGEVVKIIPPNQGKPWWPQDHPTNPDSLPEWAVRAMIDVGEMTTPEIEEAKAVKIIAEGHMWMKPQGMAFDICVRPVIEKYSGVA